MRDGSGEGGSDRREMLRRLGALGATAPALLAILQADRAVAQSGDPCIPPLGQPIPPECGGLGGEL